MSSDFLRLGVPSNLVDALALRGIETPTPIQAATLPDSLAGRDVLGRGRTGSGKTYAFLLPVVARLVAEKRRPQAKRPRSLILAPTRELATQIAESLAPLAKTAGLSVTTVFGGVGQRPQVDALARGVDVLVACPGRLLDLVGQGHADLGGVGVAVLDEADHMADMGFLPMVKRILNAVPSSAQKMLFSATLDNGVGVLVKSYLHDPVTHEADSALSPVGTMDHHVLRVDSDERVAVLADLAAAPGRTIVFTRTKHGAKRLTKQLISQGVPAVELHGNLSQGARTRNLDAFGSGRVQTMVATDIAARGIHVDEISLVVHADPPAEHKAYLHRSGRTARAGSDGTVVTIATMEQRNDVRSLMRAAGIKPAIEDAAPGAPVLTVLAPGERTFLTSDEAQKIANPLAAAQPTQGRNGRSGRGKGSGSRSSGGGRPSSGSRSSGSDRPGGERTGGDRSAGGRSRSGRGGASQGSGQRGGGGGRGQGSGGARSGRSSGGRTVYTSSSSR